MEPPKKHSNNTTILLHQIFCYFSNQALCCLSHEVSLMQLYCVLVLLLDTILYANYTQKLFSPNNRIVYNTALQWEVHYVTVCVLEDRQMVIYTKFHTHACSPRTAQYNSALYRSSLHQGGGCMGIQMGIQIYLCLYLYCCCHAMLPFIITIIIVHECLILM